jgi:hypothetical protein
MTARYTVVTTNGKYSFVGTHLKDAEKPNWHYYVVEEDGDFEKGTRLHFRKEHMVSVVERPIKP